MVKKVVGLGLVLVFLSTFVFAATRDQVLMATHLLEEQREIVRRAVSSATFVIDRINWLKSQYNEANKTADIEAGLQQLGVNIAPLIDELNTIKTNMLNILDSIEKPKIIE